MRRTKSLLPGKLANLLLPKSEEHKRRISEGVKRHWQRRREAAAQAEAGK